MNLRPLLILGIASCAGMSAAQDPQLHFTLENYSIAETGTRGLGQRAAWAQIEGDVNPNLSFTNTYLLFPGFNLLDETYLKYTTGPAQIRFGRVRSGFGIYDWSEFWYNALIAMPMIRGSRLQPGMGLTRFDAGLDYRSLIGPFEYQIGLVDPFTGTWQIAPNDPDFGVARLQTAFGPFIVGGSVLGRVAGKPTDDDATAYGLDCRWTASHLQMRGEFVRSVSSAGLAGGSYIDAFYRPPGFFRTQLAARVESISTLSTSGGGYGSGTSRAISRALTLGVRQVLTSSLAVSMDYGFGSGPSSHALRGVTFQVTSTSHF